MIQVTKTTLHIKEQIMPKKKLEKRTLFMSHVEIHDDGCWVWTAAKNNVGYGMFRYDGKMRTAHRCIMDMEGHDIQGHEVYHTCNKYECVNPDHLRVGSKTDRAQMMTTKGNSGKHWRDPAYFKTCPHCGYYGSPAVIGNFHNDRCKKKP